MYEDKVLDMVSQTIPVYHRQKKGDAQKKRPQGHFACTDCAVRPMSPTRKYITAQVVNFENPHPRPFQFIYSPHDAPYAEGRTALMLRMTRATHAGWVYYSGDEWNDQEIFIRGYWEDGKFMHRNEGIRMGDVAPIDMVDEHDEDGGPWWPEASMQMWRPPGNGAYFDLPDAGELMRVKKDDQRDHMAISLKSGLAAPTARAGWVLHDGPDPKPKKKKMNLRIEEPAGGMAPRLAPLDAAAEARLNERLFARFDAAAARPRIRWEE